MLVNEKARLEAKIPVEVKERLEFVAELENRSLTDVIISAINSYSEKVILQHKVIEVNIEDQEALAASLLNESPNSSMFASLKQAVANYNSNVEEL